MKITYYSLLCAALFSGIFPVISHAADNTSAIPFFATYPNLNISDWRISSGWSNGAHQSCEWTTDSIQGHNKNLRITLTEGKTKTRNYRCGEIASKKAYSYGRYETRMKPSYGSGMNSAFFTFVGPYQGSKIHDEIDIEFLGKDPHLVQFSYWHDAKNYDIKIYKLDYDASKEFHDYAFEWYKDKIIWFVDGKEVYRTSGKYPMPVTPPHILFSLWSGGESVNDWLGEFKYDAPKNMDVSWVKFTPFK